MYFIYFFQPLKVRTENASRLFDLKSSVLAYRAKTMKGFNNSNCVCFLKCMSLCLLQNGVLLAKDAFSGSGGGLFSCSNLCQAVPRALPYAHQ